MKNNKAQIGTLQTVIIAFLVIGIVLGVGFLVLEEFQTTLGTTSNTVTEELHTFGTSFVVNNNLSATPCFNTFAVTSITNTSTAVTVETSNYTSEAYSGTIFGEANGLDIGHSVNVSYTYLSADSAEACDGIQETEQAMNEIPTWFTIIAILVIVGILLAMVFKFAPNMGGGTSGTEGVIAEV